MTLMSLIVVLILVAVLVYILLNLQTDAKSKTYMILLVLGAFVLLFLSAVRVFPDVPIGRTLY